MKYILFHSFKLKDRVAERNAADAVAIIERQGRPDLKVRVSDVSEAGFRCHTRHRLDIGSKVVLKVKGFVRFEAKVAWQLGTEAGVQFDTPLPREEFLAYCAGLAVSEPEPGPAGQG